MNESAIMHRCMVALSEVGCRVFRNNVALAWVGKARIISKPTVVTLGPGDVVVYNGRPLHAGLSVGSGDLIGWTPGGQFLSVETKSSGGKVTTEQENFKNAVNKAGGVGIIARSAEEAVALVMQ